MIRRCGALARTVRRCGMLCAAGLLAPPAQACDQPALELSAGARYLSASDWSEYAANGFVLVREHGELPGSIVAMALQCARWTLAASASASRGVRAYTGLTSFGAPLSTESQIDGHTSSMALGVPVSDALQWTLDAQQQSFTRAIASTPTVLGYPESYARSLLRTGLQWTRDTALGRWSLSGSVAVWGAQSMRLQLPGKDPADLTFSAPSQWDLGLAWRKALGPSLFLEASLHYIETTVAASPTALLTSGGVPVGAAYQPRTRTVEQPLTLTLGWRF